MVVDSLVEVSQVWASYPLTIERTGDGDSSKTASCQCAVGWFPANYLDGPARMPK